jgi:hypothetical protein
MRNDLRRAAPPSGPTSTVAVLLVFGVTPASARVGNGFKTPSGNIFCETGYPGTGCEVVSAARNGIPCFWTMRNRGTARKICKSASLDLSGRVVVLGYGHTKAWMGIRCTSRRIGLTCRNLSGHGFFLNRVRQRIF